MTPDYETIINKVVARAWPEGYLEGVVWNWQAVAAWMLETADREGKPNPFEGNTENVEFDNWVISALIESVRWDDLSSSLVDEYFPKK